MSETKKCPHCGEVKPLDEFAKNKSRRDGLSVYCKRCNSICAAKYYKTEKGKEAHIRKNKRWRNSHPDIAADKLADFINSKDYHGDIQPFDAESLKGSVIA